MRLPLTKLENITLTIRTTPLLLSPLCPLLLVRLGGYIVNLCTFYFYKLIGKLRLFCSQLQEFSFLILPVASSTTVAWCSPPRLSVYVKHVDPST
jgi:hypothetical protein